MISTFPIAPLKNIKNMSEFVKKHKDNLYVTVEVDGKFGFKNLKSIYRVELKDFKNSNDLVMN